MNAVSPVSRTSGLPRLKTFIDKPLLFRYTAAVLTVIIVTLGRGYIQSLLPARGAYLPFYAAVLYSAWAFGSRPAILALIAAGLGANVLYIKPNWVFSVGAGTEAVTLPAFWVIGIFSIYLIELQRGYAQQLEVEIQQRAQTETKLVQSEERFRMATATLQGGIYDWDSATNQTWRSSGLFELLGYQFGEVSADFDWWWDQIHPDDQKPVRQQIDQFNAERRVGRVLEYRIRHKDRHYSWVLDNSRVVYKPDGGYQRVSGLTISIDARKQAEARSQILLDFATQLSRAVISSEVVDIITQTALQAVGGDTSSVFRFSSDIQQLERLNTGAVETSLTRSLTIPIDARLPIADAVREKKVLFISSQAEYVSLYPHLEADIKRIQVHTLICLPFFVHDHLLGGMYIAFTHPHTIEIEERSFLFLMAQLCGQALERVNLYEAEHQARQEAERKSARIEALQSVTANLSAAATAQEVFQVIVNRAFPILGVHMGAVSLLSDDQNGINIVAQFAVSQTILDQYQFIPFTVPTPVSDVARTRQPIWIKSLEEYERLYPNIPKQFHQQFHTQAIACLPLIVNDKLIGAIGMSFPTPQNFDAEDRDYLNALAQQSAQALLRAQLSEQAQQLAVLQERQRIARELHDGATQSIFTANILLETVIKVWESKPEKALSIVEQIRELTQGAGSEMRMLLYEFRPENIARAQLLDLLNHLMRALKNRKTISVTMNLTGDHQFALPPDVHLTFYRIAQEGLNNIAKHGQAKHVHIRLRHAQNYVSLSIMDDGRGFDSRTITPGFGLHSMRERAESIGATFRIRSRVKAGTRILLLWKPPKEPAQTALP